MIKTHVIWNQDGLTASEEAQIVEQAEIMHQQQKTDNQIILLVDTGKEKIVERQWNSIEYAEEWISFVLTFNPKSAVIINE